VDLMALQKWNHFNTLFHPKQLNNTPKIKVALILADKEETIDLLDTTYTLNPLPERGGGEQWMAKYKIKVTNISDENLYISVLTLGSDMSITANPFHNESILLAPKTEKYFYDFDPYNRRIRCFLDTYKEVYNWQYEWFNYKFIVSETGDFSGSIPTFLQDGFYPPRLISNPMASVSRKKYLNKDHYWEIYTSSIRLKNPTYNEISGDLAARLAAYLKEERIAPYLRQVYPAAVLEEAGLASS